MFNKINILAKGQTMTVEHSDAAMRELNVMLKEWMAYPAIWRLKEGYITMVAATASYSLTPRPYRIVDVDMLKGAHKLPEHVARHPFGRVPVIDHDGFRLYETTAITRYIDELFPGEKLQPTDVKSRARMNQVIGIVDAYAYDAIIVGLVMQRFVAPLVGGRTDAVNPEHRGTKAAASYALTVDPGATEVVRLRLRDASGPAQLFGPAFDQLLAARRREADEFYRALTPDRIGEDEARVMRQALQSIREQVRAGQHAEHAGQSESGTRIDRSNARMRMR